MTDTAMTDTEPAELPPLPAGIRPLPTVESRWIQARYPDLPKTPDEGCPTCRLRKTFRWYRFAEEQVEGRTVRRRTDEVVDYVCPCRQQWLAEQVLLHAGIGRAYQKLDWEDFFEPPPGVEQILDYVARLDDYVAAGAGLFLGGSRGTGKTMIGMLLGKRLVGMGVDVYATSFTDLLDSYAAGWDSPELRDWFTRRVRNARVLLLDEVGREYKGGKINDSVLEGVLRHRAQHCLPTILMSNLSINQIGEGYGGHSLSLLIERAIPVEMSGSDARQRFNERMLAELRAKLTRPVVV